MLLRRAKMWKKELRKLLENLRRRWENLRQRPENFEVQLQCDEKSRFLRETATKNSPGNPTLVGLCFKKLGVHWHLAVHKGSPWQFCPPTQAKDRFLVKGERLKPVWKQQQAAGQD